MPNRDGTGPQGRGKMSGQGMGNCEGEGKKGNNVPFENGQGKRCGRGIRRGSGNRRTNIVEESKGKNNNE